MALGGVPLPESEEAIFTEFLKETEKESGAYSCFVCTVQGGASGVIVGWVDFDLYVPPS